MNITQENIKKYGWEAIYVFDEEGDKQPYLYTIGLQETYSHPELMIFGLAKKTMHNIISDIAKDIEAGFVAPINKKIKGKLAGDFEAIFKIIDPNNHNSYLGQAERHYKMPFTALVMFWPDKNNVLPTDSGCEIDTQNEALNIVQSNNN